MIAFQILFSRKIFIHTHIHRIRGERDEGFIQLRLIFHHKMYDSSVYWLVVVVVVIIVHT